jgi:uncharacterized protein YjbI with pentapeptide repeats
MSDDDTADRLIDRSFRGQSLEGADFSGKDLRGADFTGADLRSASFRDAKLGVAPRVGAVLFGLAILVAIAAGVGIGWAVNQIRDELSAEKWDEAAEGGSIGLILLVLVALILWRGFDFAIRISVVFYVVVLVVNIVANLLWDEVEWVSALRATAVIVFLVLAIVVGMLGRVVGGVFGTWSVAFVAVIGGLATGQAEGGVAGVVVAMSLAFISKRAVQGDERDRSLSRLAHRLVGRWGTQFVDADLTGADLTGTDGSRCSVKGATLDGVTWDPDKPRPLDMADDAVPS